MTEILSRKYVSKQLALIEAEVPGIRAAYEGVNNHGDSCWKSDVAWHPLADDYESLRWLNGTEKTIE